MPDHDALLAVFAEFRNDELTRIRPAGLAPVRLRARRRHRMRLAGRSLLAAAAVAAGVPLIGQLNAMAPRHQAPAAPVETPDSYPGCSPGEIVVELTGDGSVASEQCVVISFINDSPSPCALSGYPSVTGLSGHLVGTPQEKLDLPFAVHNGPLSSRSDPGRVPVVLPPGEAASFALGTGTSYQDMYAVEEVVVTLPGGREHFLVGLPTGMLAGAPHDQAIPITVTGLVGGKAGPPQ